MLTQRLAPLTFWPSVIIPFASAIARIIYLNACSSAEIFFLCFKYLLKKILPCRSIFEGIRVFSLDPAPEN
jgi:hypothetical protein